MGTTGGDGGDIGVDSRQLLLVGICVFGLIAAAFLAPVVGANNLLSPGGSGASAGDGGEDSRERPTAGGEDGDPSDGDRVDIGRGGGEGGVGGTGDPDDGCFVVVESDPKPGANATVQVTVDGSAAADVRVWFNGRYVGRTDRWGRVTGTVPFVTELDVTVESPTDEPCRFSRQDDPGFAAQSGVVGSGVAAAGAGVSGASRGALAMSDGGSARQQGGVNNSSRYTVASDVSIRLAGDPIPGSNVTLTATVESVAIPDATVTVDGERVGRTDENGRYRLTVPDRDSVRVAVARGEIRGETTIDVHQLSVRFAPRLVVPGERATVVVTRGGEPVENASVTLAGQRLDTTGPNGTVSFALPNAVDGTVRAETDRQSATVPLWLAYWLSAGLALVLCVLTTTTTAVAARLGGRGAARRVAVLWGGVWTLFVGYVVGEGLGFAVAAAAVALVALYRYRRAVASGGATAGQLLAGFLEWCSRAVLWVVGALESLVDWARAGALRAAAWLRSLPTSLSGLAARLGAWLRSLPARLGAAIRSLPLRAVAAVIAAVAVVAAATYAYGGRGFLVSAALVAVVALGWWLSRRERGGASAAETAAPVTGSAHPDDDSAVPTLRQLWRRLARWVLPGTWQTRTPAEVSRAAVERGLPREPVETLTEAFRDVEYGGQSEAGRQTQAQTAFDALETARDTDDEEAQE